MTVCGVLYVSVVVQVTSVRERVGVGRKTPMALLLDEWGIEPDVKYIS